MPRNPVGQRQFLSANLIAFRVDGSDVSAVATSNAGLLVGKYQGTVVKGTSSDANLVTFTFKSPLGQPPLVFFQPITADCECRLEGEPTKTGFAVRTLKSTNLATAVNDADFCALVVGSEDIREGRY